MKRLLLSIAAMTAMTATTGADIPPIAAPKEENAAFAPAIIDGRLDTSCISLPTPTIVLPMTTSRGPSAATTRAILTMVSLTAGDRALNLSTRA